MLFRSYAACYLSPSRKWPADNDVTFEASSSSTSSLLMTTTQQSTFCLGSSHSYNSWKKTRYFGPSQRDRPSSQEQPQQQIGLRTVRSGTGSTPNVVGWEEKQNHAIEKETPSGAPPRLVRSRLAAHMAILHPLSMEEVFFADLS